MLNRKRKNLAHPAQIRYLSWCRSMSAEAGCGGREVKHRTSSATELSRPASSLFGLRHLWIERFTNSYFFGTLRDVSGYLLVKR
jgi:hypothetical protein